MATYLKTTNPTATYGEDSPSVLELQKSLNAKGATLALDSKYGPLTKAAYDQYNTPTPTEDTGRYARTANKNDKSIADLSSKLSGLTGKEPSLQSITNQKRNAAQGLIDSVTAQFSKTLADQGVVNAGMNDRVRALNVSAGLGGSDFATAAAVKQEGKNQKAIEMIENERNAKINEILSGIDERASTEYQTQRQDYIRNLGNDLDRMKEARDEDRTRAKESIAGLASSGVSIEKLKTTDPTSYNTLLTEYGGSQLDLESACNAALPDDQKVKCETNIIRGKNGEAIALRYGINPRTGTIDKKEYNLGSSYDDFKGADVTETADGIIYRRNANGTLTPLTTKQSDTEDVEVTQELRDAQAAIDAGADQDEVRRMFLDKYPKKG